MGDYDKKVPDYDKKVPESEKKVPESEKKVPESEKKVPESEKAPESDKKYLKKAEGHIDRNGVQIAGTMRTIVRIIQIMLNVLIFRTLFYIQIMIYHCGLRISVSDYEMLEISPKMFR